MLKRVLNFLRSKKTLSVIIVICLIIVVAVLALIFLRKDKEEDISLEEEWGDKNIVIDIEEDIVYTEETRDIPQWINENNDGPWYENLYIAYSEDGLNFSGEKLFLPHAGVGNLILGKDGEIIATFQYFSYENQELFDKICYTISTDNGLTWSSVKRVNISDLPPGPNAVDPTLLLLDDGRYRLYFTYESHGDGNPQLYSAIANDIDDEFVNEGKQLETDSIILDPAVVYFKGKYHHYTVSHDSGMDMSNTGFHSVSDTGLDFEEVGTFEGEMQFLGDVIEVDGGLRFYGSGIGVESAFSTDGYDWTMDEGSRVQGADPGVVMLEDGSYVIIYTVG